MHELDGWSLSRRRTWLRGLDRLIVCAKERICSVVAQEKHVSPENVLLNEYAPTRLLVRSYAKHLEHILGDEDRSNRFSATFAHKRDLIRKEPFGCAGIITPFNYPFTLSLSPIVAAIAAGNSVVWKAAQETPRTNALVRELLYESLYPFDKGNLLETTGTSAEDGKLLVRSPKIRKIHFTGSVASGWQVLQTNSSARMTPPALELGGSNAAIVLEDADLEQAAHVIVWSRFSGLSCLSIKRVFAVGPIFDELSQRIKRLVSRLQPNEIVSQLPEREQKNFVRFVTDYQRRTGMPVGYAYGNPKPLVLCIPLYDPDFAVLSEETFCPILPVVAVSTQDDAIWAANDTKFGLGASVFTKSKERFRRIARELDCAGVYHNCANTEYARPQLPFGGRKESGTGFTHGPEGLLEFVQLKIISEETLPFPKLYLYPWLRKGWRMRFLTRWIDWIVAFS